MYYPYSAQKLHYEVVGAGRPVLLLHGLECNLDLMKRCLEPVFETGTPYQRIYIDLPGMGDSLFSADYASSDRILEVLLCFIRDIVKEPFLLAGESYGGYLARGILAKLPKRVDGLLLLCPVVVSQPEGRDLPGRGFALEDGDYLSTLPPHERKEFCEYAVVADARTYQRYQTDILPGLRQADRRFIADLLRHYSFSFDVDKEIHQRLFTKPALFLCGRQDTCVGYRDLWRLIEDYPRAAFSLLDTAGHNLQIERPDLFASLVRDWLTRVEKER